MEAFAVVLVAETYALATWHNVLLCVLRPGSPEAFAASSEAQVGLRERYGDHLVSLTILDGNFTPLFSPKSRALARKQLAHSRGATRAMAIAVLTEGLLASATRATMNALSALLKLDFEWRTFDAIPSACHWLAPHVIPPADPAELTAIAEHAFELTGKGSKNTPS